ncbi:VOC family protein [Myxococcota bacterium]|nr:VOC family protein [Myxococcota bacterium]
MKLHAYLNFDGTTEAAFRFYAEALGGSLTDIHRFGAMPGGERLTEEQKNRVMHVGLQLPDGQMLMASDRLEGWGPPPVVGNNFSISVHPDSREEADRLFAALAEGGTVTMPLADQFWGAYYGGLVDKFGIQWMLNFEPRR